MLNVIPLRFAGSREADDADARLSDWTDAYRRLKMSQARLKVAGSSATLQMRAERDRLQRMAEQALKALTAQGKAGSASPAPRPLRGLHPTDGPTSAAAAKGAS